MKKNYEEFITYVEKNLLSLMSDGVKRSVYIKDIHKTEEISLKVLAITNTKNNKVVNVNLECFYEEYSVGYRSLDEILNEIADLCFDAEQDSSDPFDIEALQEANIIGCLVGIKSNKDFLKDIPFVPFGKEFAVIFKHYFGRSSDGSTIASITITDYIAERLGYDTSKLMQLALKNTPRLMPLSIQKMSDVLSMLNWNDDELSKHKDIPMYVISNTLSINGAFALFYPETLRMLFEKLGCDMVLIPSSVHECIIVPYDSSISFEKVNETIMFINQTQLTEKEVLADRAYLLKKGTTDIFKQFIADYAYSK